jgi:general secretion pathway protein A
MVLEYYNLQEQPFGVTPDSRYLYSSATHREALASLLYGLEAGRGFVALIAKPGMGKTTLLFQALNQLKDKAKVVFVFQTVCTPVDFLRAVLADLGVHETQGSLIELQAKLNEVVTEQSRLGKPLVIVIDEAQNLDDSVLELVRMLSNFETSREKLIQIILSGQPQLADKLASPDLVQLRQRVSILSCLKPFSPEETALYVDHRLRIAGYSGEAPLFTNAALALIADVSEGIPRNINNLCFNALSLGCALKRRTIDCDIVREVVADLDLEPLRERKSFAPRPEEDDAVLEAIDDLDLEPLHERTSLATGSPTEMDGARGVPVFASIASSPPRLTGWIPKLIIACAILLALGGAIFQGHRWVIAKTVVRANSGVPPLVPTSPSLASRDQARVGTSPAGIIRVAPGQSLYRICVENFGSCSPGRLQEIRALNPWLSNLDHIESGQRIRIPVVEELSSPTQKDIAQSGNALLAERSRQ